MSYLYSTKIDNNVDPSLVHNKSKFLKVPASSGHKNAIDQILGNEEIRSQLVDTKAAGEVPHRTIPLHTLSASIATQHCGCSIQLIISRRFIVGASAGEVLCQIEL